MSSQVTDRHAHLFTVLFQIHEAREPDDYAERVYQDDELEDALLGGPDAAGIIDLDFEREDTSFPTAVLRALRDIQRVFPEATLLRVEPDDLVTIAAIADRVGRSHESVRLLARGERGHGDFPAPAGQLDAKTRVWRWSEVARWFEDGVGPLAAGQEAGFLAAVNDLLDLRRVAPEAIDDSIASDMAALLPEQLAVALRTAA